MQKFTILYEDMPTRYPELIPIMQPMLSEKYATNWIFFITEKFESYLFDSDFQVNISRKFLYLYASVELFHT